MSETTKQKGDLLENIVSQICSGIKNAKSEANVKLMGKSGVLRQIDTLVTGNIGAFEVKILIDSKNHISPVDINSVESMEGMVADVGANVGVIVCPAGFTDGAKKRAESGGVQLYEIYDESLGNSSLLIPLRYIEARIDKYNFSFSSSSAAGPFSIPTDPSRWIFHIDGVALKPAEVPTYIWNKELVPQEVGNHNVTLGAVKVTDTEDKNLVQYCDLNVGMIIVEDYYLKLFPASFIRRARNNGKELFDLKIDIYSKIEDMLANGWIRFSSFEELNKSADIENQPPGIRKLLMKNYFSIKQENKEVSDN